MVNSYGELKGPQHGMICKSATVLCLDVFLVLLKLPLYSDCR